jgi:hypothetical protein
MFIVQRRVAKTLIPLIKQQVKEFSEINSDEWRAYRKLKKEGYSHFTVNHTENFVDPKTGSHTQLFECHWNVAKIEIDKRARGRSEHLLHGYLAQKWFLSITSRDIQSRFVGICHLLKENTYKEILDLTEKKDQIQYSNER